MTAAEDYDLWLRILIDHEVGLLDEALVTRRAGHGDQLSSIVSAIDRFRILALARLLTDQRLSGTRRAATSKALAEKCLIYAKGLIRRGAVHQARFYNEVAERSVRTWAHVPDPVLLRDISQLRELVSASSGRQPPECEHRSVIRVESC